MMTYEGNATNNQPQLKTGPSCPIADFSNHPVNTLANCHLAHWLLSDCHSVYKNTSTLFHHIQQVNKFKNTAFKKNRVKKFFKNIG